MKKRLISILLVLVLVLCTMPIGQAYAKSKKYTTLKIPTDDYESDTILSELISDVDYTTKVSGNNTLIKFKTDDLQKFLKELKKDMNSTIKEITKSGNLTKISLSKDMKKISITQKKEANDEESLSLLGLYISTMYYQFFNGTAYDKIDCYITVKDTKGKVIEKGSFKDSFN